jgi:3-dehydroquinate synthetase
LVDASVGGKTAIDRPQGKNLVGAFHQPSAVIADVELLSTLPARELRSGMSEVIKTALIGDLSLLEMLERDERDLASLVRASIAHKARVVASDEHDRTGARAALNFGHTVGHALEAHAGFERLTHGEAVSLGMIAALTIGIAKGITPAPLLERARTLLGRNGLPVDLGAEPLADALPRILSDKKREGDEVAFVLLEDLGRPRNVRLSLAEVREALGA